MNRNTPLLLPPALAFRHGEAVVLEAGEDIRPTPLAEARERLITSAHLVAHAAFTARRLRLEPKMRLVPHFDVLELFLFVRPAQMLLPDARGLAAAMRWTEPVSAADDVRILRQAAMALLAEIRGWPEDKRLGASGIAADMARAGWLWGPSVLDALAIPEDKLARRRFPDWSALEDWEERPLPAAASSRPVPRQAVDDMLGQILGAQSEDREGQRRYARLAAHAFQPKNEADEPLVVIAEAGTGTGKTAGYLAPALSWSDLNGSGLWLSTYTKALQKQLLRSFEALYPDPHLREELVAVRKGRENYLCLLNFDEVAAGRRMLGGPEAIVLGLVARWAEATQDGDLMSGDFPAWAWPHPGMAPLLTLRHGECLYGACPHFRRCLIENAGQRARGARIVIANHALVMAEAAHDLSGGFHPVRLVLDEGHHVFHAADEAFALHVTGAEGMRLRRWARGPEGRKLTRGRSLRDRAGDFIPFDPEVEALADDVESLMRELPQDGWLSRIVQGQPRGAMERFLAAARAQVLARASGDAGYGLECEVTPLSPEVDAMAEPLARGLADLGRAMMALAKVLKRLLETHIEALDETQKIRIEVLIRGLERRSLRVVGGWIAALRALGGGDDPRFVNWFGIERAEGREFDFGLYRHWVDPTLPLAETVLRPAHGVLITSATLRERGGAGDAAPSASAVSAETPQEAGWDFADRRLGVAHLLRAPLRGAFLSPFDYASQARIIVVRDLDRREGGQMAAAYRALFQASRGGGLGLFTSVRALRAIHALIASPLAGAGIELFAQHVDGLDTGTLIDLFRADENACLLGTDALRDGIDVPGRSLRLVVFDSVPWPRPDILHKARRAHFGRGYDDALARGRLAQAFGRLIRRDGDRGVFVILDARTPSRLLTGLPPEASLTRCGIAEAVELTRTFLAGF